MPSNWSALCVVVLLLGMRHGFDADHLATIDGLTRLNQRRGFRVARYCGALFSLGHGVVVIGIATFVGMASARWTPPQWLDALGSWISILFLLGLGAANIHAVLSTHPDDVVSMVGWKSRWLRRWTQASHPLAIAGVGVLFALSFDTVSQAALFSAAAAQFGGTWHALLLGLLFVAGMLFTDGLNGWWISRLIARADRVALLASRIMSAAVGSVSLLVGLLGLSEMLFPHVGEWFDGKELALGATVVCLMLISYVVARWMAQRAAVPVVADASSVMPPIRR